MMLPKITELEFNIEQTETVPKIGKSFLFDFEKGEFVLENGKMVELHGIDALKMWIEKVIQTEKFRFEIYEGIDYGVTIEDLIGSNLPRAFIEAEIKREVTSSLETHPYIQDITNWQFVRNGKRMSVKFQVITVDGAFDQGVNLVA
ncbi:DUF2634 domain-containing protein [Priestia abyssalis]|uniref:DUF2634 domain-containing protein n=1 Tax=Priestia abyssalis TaxID=1221450 RepID=UPI000994F912|nr:DUF2634 domain-containing protein [Priestia abyssalis]